MAISRSQMYRQLKNRGGIMQLEPRSNYILGGIAKSVKKAVKKGDDVSLIGFGTFTKTRRAARTGINPATGEKIKIKAKILSVTFVKKYISIQLETQLKFLI